MAKVPLPDRVRLRGRSHSISRSRSRSRDRNRSHQDTEDAVALAFLKSAEFTGWQLGRILFTVAPNLNAYKLHEVVDMMLVHIARGIADGFAEHRAIGPCD